MQVAVRRRVSVSFCHGAFVYTDAGPCKVALCPGTRMQHMCQCNAPADVTGAVRSSPQSPFGPPPAKREPESSRVKRAMYRYPSGLTLCSAPRGPSPHALQPPHATCDMPHRSKASAFVFQVTGPFAFPSRPTANRCSPYLPCNPGHLAVCTRHAVTPHSPSPQPTLCFHASLPLTPTHVMLKRLPTPQPNPRCAVTPPLSALSANP